MQRRVGSLQGSLIDFAFAAKPVRALSRCVRSRDALEAARSEGGLERSDRRIGQSLCTLLSLVPRLSFTGGEDQSYFFNSLVAGSSPAGPKGNRSSMAEQ